MHKALWIKLQGRWWCFKVGSTKYEQKLSRQKVLSFRYTFTLSPLQVTTIFLVDAAECMPTAGDWPQIWKEQEEWKADKVKLEGDAMKRKVRIERQILEPCYNEACCQTKATPPLLDIDYLACGEPLN